jgi:hypothetical protein
MFQFRLLYFRCFSLSRLYLFGLRLTKIYTKNYLRPCILVYLVELSFSQVVYLGV